MVDTSKNEDINIVFFGVQKYEINITVSFFEFRHGKGLISKLE
jgi:hypothetical protein